jgi:hypothetical protein
MDVNFEPHTPPLFYPKKGRVPTEKGANTVPKLA